MANTVIVSTSDSNMDDVPLWMQAAGIDPAINYSGNADRSLLDGLFTTQGVLGSPAFRVTQRGAGANFSVDIAAGQLVILGDDGANQGKYLCRSLGTVNCVTPSAPASGTRVHRIIARVRDKQVIGTGTYDWTLELLEDTGTGTPAEPNSAVTLALVSIAAGQASVQNSNITDQRPQAQVFNSAGLIQEVVLSAAAASVSFQSIPQTYKHLMFVVHARSDAGGTTPIDTTVRLNNDSGTNYSGAHLDLPMGGSLGTVTASGNTNAGTFMIPANGVSGGMAGGGFMWLIDYSSTVWKSKQWFTFTAATDFGSIGDHKVRWACWAPSSAAGVNRLDLTCASGNFMANSYFGLYGYGS